MTNIYIESWQQELLDNPPQFAKLNLTTKEWEEMVLEELDPTIPMAPYTFGKEHHWWGRKHTEETKRKIALSKLGRKMPQCGNKGKANPMYGVRGEEHHWWGRKHSADARKRMSEAKKDYVPWNVGKSHSESTRKNISQALKNKPKISCPHCDKVGSASNMKRYHFDNCKRKRTEATSN
jgi:hypothetical protein